MTNDTPGVTTAAPTVTTAVRVITIVASSGGTTIMTTVALAGTTMAPSERMVSTSWAILGVTSLIVSAVFTLF